MGWRHRAMALVAVSALGRAAVAEAPTPSAAEMAAAVADAPAPGSGRAHKMPFANPRVAGWARELLLPDCEADAPGAAALTWERLAQVPPDSAHGPALQKFVEAAVAVATLHGAPIARCPPQPARVALQFATLAKRARADPTWGNLLARECAAIAAFSAPAGADLEADLLQGEARWRCALALASLHGRYTAARRTAMRQARLLQASLPAARQAALLRDPDVRALRTRLGETSGRVLTPAAASRRP